MVNMFLYLDAPTQQLINIFLPIYRYCIFFILVIYDGIENKMQDNKPNSDSYLT